MNQPIPPTAAPANRRRRRSLRFAVASIAVLAATPAAATVIMQNFAKVDVSKSAACMVKIAGADADDFDTAGQLPFVDFSDTGSLAVNGTDLINEQISITALQGDRLLISDAMRIKNTCNYDLDIQLTAEADPAGNAMISTWSNLYMKLYIGDTPSAALPGGNALPFTLANNWNQTAIEVSSTGTVLPLSTATIPLAAGSELQVGALIDTDRALTPTSTGTLRFTVSGTAQP